MIQNYPFQAARSVPRLPLMYHPARNFVSGGSPHSVQQYTPAKAGDRVLDIGCGPGDIIALLADVQYVDFDMESKDIAAVV